MKILNIKIVMQIFLMCGIIEETIQYIENKKKI